jgi:hypothetical protein
MKSCWNRVPDGGVWLASCQWKCLLAKSVWLASWLISFGCGHISHRSHGQVTLPVVYKVGSTAHYFAIYFDGNASRKPITRSLHITHSVTMDSDSDSTDKGPTIKDESKNLPRMPVAGIQVY